MGERASGWHYLTAEGRKTQRKGDTDFLVPAVEGGAGRKAGKGHLQGGGEEGHYLKGAGLLCRVCFTCHLSLLHLLETPFSLQMPGEAHLFVFSINAKYQVVKKQSSPEW